MIKGSKRGPKTTKVVELTLENAGIHYEKDVRGPEIVSKTDGVDFQIQGDRFIHVSTDVSRGTFQGNRLEHYYQMFRAGLWDKNNVFIFLGIPGPVPHGKRGPSPRTIGHEEAYNYLKSLGVIGGTDELLAWINYEQEKQT